MSPWCQTPGRSLATWRETQHTATRSCVTPGSLQAQSSELIEHISYLRSTNVSSCIYFQSVPWQSHAAGWLCGSCQRGRCSHSWSKYMQRRGKICALQLLCKWAAHSTQTQVGTVLQKSYSFSLYLFSDSVVAHADYHGGDSSNWPPRYSALSLQHAVNVQSQVWTADLNISFIILMQTPWWQCEDWSGLMCTEATRKGAPMASTSDFWGTEYIK